MSHEGGKCSICGRVVDGDSERSEFAAAGELLAEDLWDDKGTLCVQCLENRGRLAMMYMHEVNR